MASYTIQLRKIIEFYGIDEVKSWFTNYELSDYLSSEQIETINNRNVWTKEKLAQKILDHYYFRDIGSETPSLFKHYAKVAMQEIMEKYLPIIYTNSIDYDMFESVDFHIEETRQIDGEVKGNSKSSSSSNSDGLSISNDTPQGKITKQEIETGAYASNVGQNNSNTNIEDNTNTNSNSQTIEEFKHYEHGNKGVLDNYQKMIMQYRETINATDIKIINELSNLFMGIY